MTGQDTDWSEVVAAMLRAVSGQEPVLALFLEQKFGTIILGLAHSPTGRLVLLASDTDDETVTITLDRDTAQKMADALNAWLERQS